MVSTINYDGEAYAVEIYWRDTLVVKNLSYDNPDEHKYFVILEDKQPVDCCCPHRIYDSAVCKHMFVAGKFVQNT